MKLLLIQTQTMTDSINSIVPEEKTLSIIDSNFFDLQKPGSQRD